jgi:hypothetical protein
MHVYIISHTYVCNMHMLARKAEDDKENEGGEEESAEMLNENTSEGAADLKQAYEPSHELSHEVGGGTIQSAYSSQDQDFEIDSDLDDNLYLWTPDGLFFLIFVLMIKILR